MRAKKRRKLNYGASLPVAFPVRFLLSLCSFAPFASFLFSFLPLLLPSCSSFPSFPSCSSFPSFPSCSSYPSFLPVLTVLTSFLFFLSFLSFPFFLSFLPSCSSYPILPSCSSYPSFLFLLPFPRFRSLSLLRYFVSLFCLFVRSLAAP